jgi:hyperosmotically inducible periplasmic protein
MKTTAKIIAAAMVLSFGLAAQTNSEATEDQILAGKVARELANQNRFHGPDLDAEDGIVLLSGKVDLYIDKVDAERKVRKVAGVDGVRNHIVVDGKNASDAELRETLANKLRYDRIGYGIVFNNLAIQVADGKVTVSGSVRDYPDRNSAIALVETTPGVRAVVDEIDVAPLSEFDDRLRINLARAIYGHSSLQKYAMDPQAPIRIVVENGNVELHGVVLNEMDKQIAFAQANSVPGIFKMSNRIVVAR